MKICLEKIKEKYYILLIIIIIMFTGMILDLILFNHSTKYNEESIKNPYEVEVGPNDNYVFLGDSLTDFYNLDEWYDGLPVINSGISGYTTTDILENIDDMVSKYNPTKVFILIGTNDINKGKTEEEIFNNIKEIVSSILKERPNTKIYIQSLYPINNTDNEKIDHNMVGDRTNKIIKRINKNLKKYCELKNYVYINVYDELTDEEGNLALKYTAEGLHLNSTGYVKVTKILYKYINDAI